MLVKVRLPAQQEADLELQRWRRNLSLLKENRKEELAISKNQYMEDMAENWYCSSLNELKYHRRKEERLYVWSQLAGLRLGAARV